MKYGALMRRLLLAQLLPFSFLTRVTSVKVVQKPEVCFARIVC